MGWPRVPLGSRDRLFGFALLAHVCGDVVRARCPVRVAHRLAAALRADQRTSAGVTMILARVFLVTRPQCSFHPARADAPPRVWHPACSGAVLTPSGALANQLWRIIRETDVSKFVH